MDLQIRGHVAIVQGATRGLGRGTAEALAGEGCNIVVTSRNASDAEQAAVELAKVHGVRALGVAADSADIAAGSSLLARVSKEFGRLDILVCNSGGPTPGGLRDLTPEQWSTAAHLLLTAPAALLRESLALLEKSPAPRFFVITSSSTREPVAGLTLSNTLRPGLVGLVKSLAQELAPAKICCHSIAPGRFDTDRLRSLQANLSTKSGKSVEDVKNGMLAAIPAGRFGEPIELGRLIAWLSSPLSGYMTGGNWLVDGGLIRSI